MSLAVDWEPEMAVAVAASLSLVQAVQEHWMAEAEGAGEAPSWVMRFGLLHE